jgi:hypothetical protein
MEKFSLTPWSVHAEGGFSVKLAAGIIMFGIIAYFLGQLSVIRACLGF